MTEDCHIPCADVLWTCDWVVTPTRFFLLGSFFWWTNLSQQSQFQERLTVVLRQSENGLDNWKLKKCYSVWSRQDRFLWYDLVVHKCKHGASFSCQFVSDPCRYNVRPDILLRYHRAAISPIGKTLLKLHSNNRSLYCLFAAKFTPFRLYSPELTINLSPTNLGSWLNVYFGNI
jgi:hypothetical protein